MPLKGIPFILLGTVLIVLREKILNYYEFLNERNRRPINRQIMLVRLLVVASLAILIGMAFLIKSL